MRNNPYGPILPNEEEAFFDDEVESPDDEDEVFDPVVNPAHYTEGRTIEPLQVIEDWELNFALGNVIKYISRVDRKDNPIQDLEKALFYLQTELNRRHLS